MKCKASHKVYFATEALAIEAAKTPKYFRLRYYWCPRCYGWHFTKLKKAAYDRRLLIAQAGRDFANLNGAADQDRTDT